MDFGASFANNFFSRVSAGYMRNFIFGVEDSLVSTVGLLSGVAVAGVDRSSILLTGVVLIFVEAFSMGVGSFLSDHSIEEYAARAEVPLRNSVRGATVMFVSYFISGFIPLVPYALWPADFAFWASIALSLAALFLLGAIGARILKIGIFHKGFEMLVIGGIAIGVGVSVGRLFVGF